MRSIELNQAHLIHQKNPNKDNRILSTMHLALNNKNNFDNYNRAPASVSTPSNKKNSNKNKRVPALSVLELLKILTKIIGFHHLQFLDP